MQIQTKRLLIMQDAMDVVPGAQLNSLDEVYRGFVPFLYVNLSKMCKKTLLSFVLCAKKMREGFGMKKGITLVLAVLLCMCACCAMADDFGKAVIDGRNSSKVHLREKPTTESKSLGLYFTGTEVTCKSDPRGEWVDVKIGRERGYMKSDYLKTGAAADRVTPRWQAGTIIANKYARMRKGPSTEYQFICNVNEGEDVTVMGETDEHWYYVKYKGEKGFISANLVYTSGKTIYTGSASSSAVSTPVRTPAPVLTPIPAQTWKSAYRDFILSNYHESMKYALCYVDHDSIPELAIDTGSEAGGCIILTWHDGLLDALQTRRRGFTYRERQNQLCNSDGNMGYYYDDIYEIRNGKWTMTAFGSYDNPEGWDSETGRYICNHYVWNGREVTQAQYMLALDQAYNRTYAKQAIGFVDLPGIITVLRE